MGGRSVPTLLGASAEGRSQVGALWGPPDSGRPPSGSTRSSEDRGCDCRRRLTKKSRLLFYTDAHQKWEATYLPQPETVPPPETSRMAAAPLQLGRGTIEESLA